MCTVILALGMREDAPLIVAANRDEWRQRATEPFAMLLPAAIDRPAIYGGRDLAAGGTWFGVRPDGAMALLTNLHTGDGRDTTKKSRGEIVLQLLAQPTFDRMQARMAELEPSSYNPFNVLFGLNGVWAHASSIGSAITPVSRGVHLLGNLALDDPTDPKTALLQARAANLEALPLLDARESLRRQLLQDFYVDSGAYGTRWSMLYAGPHAPINAVEISEKGDGDFASLTVA